MQVELIGRMHSCYKEKFGTPRQGNLVPHAHGFIEFDKKWDPHKALQGLEEFSHVWVVFWFHQNPAFTYKPLTSPPRLAPKRLGVLATRSPLRPNPIGLSLLKIEKIVGDRLYVSGLDLVDQTPVIDIKPYIHAYDSAQESRSGWVEAVPNQPLAVQFSNEALARLNGMGKPHVQQAIIDILSSDIRNRNDKREQKAGKELGFYFEDLNIVFQVTAQRAQVLRIEDRT